MKILTLCYGWISYIHPDQYRQGDYEYVETIYNDEDGSRYVWGYAFKILGVDWIDIIQGYDGTYYWTMI